MSPIEPNDSDARTQNLTCVDLTCFAGKIEHTVLFGVSIGTHQPDAHHRTSWFWPGSVFAVLRWAATNSGASLMRLEILRALRAHEAGTQVPFIHPAVQILLQASGWTNVQHAIRAIDAVRALGIDPVHVRPEYWQQVGNCLAAGQSAPPYSRIRHRVWQLRRQIVI